MASVLIGVYAARMGMNPIREVRSWRQFRERWTRNPETEFDYDAGPDVERPPRVQPWLLVFDDDGNFTGEAELIDTDGLSVREFAYALQKDSGPHGRFWLANRLIQGHARLVERIGLYPGVPEPDGG